MQASSTEFKKQKRESQVQKIPPKTLTKQSNKIQNAKITLAQNIQEIQDTMRRTNLRIIGIEENENSQLKEPVNIFNKIMEEKFPNLKKEMPMNIQEAY